MVFPFLFLSFGFGGGGWDLGLGKRAEVTTKINVDQLSPVYDTHSSKDLG